ncbi:hypothetical protein [Streptomyces chartreusis]|uniref:hypothetical protein n=1 Tax=Streptomyces chartreusis TaxID=1969 RepID=UPI0036628C12
MTPHVLGDCVAGLWGAATALLDLVPSLDGRLGLLGESFGALALPWDDGGWGDPRPDAGASGPPCTRPTWR